jgi:hypothetical protein
VDTLAELEGFDADEFRAAQERLTLAEGIETFQGELDNLRSDGPALRATAAADAGTRDRLQSSAPRQQRLAALSTRRGQSRNWPRRAKSSSARLKQPWRNWS